MQGHVEISPIYYLIVQWYIQKCAGYATSYIKPKFEKLHYDYLYKNITICKACEHYKSYSAFY